MALLPDRVFNVRIKLRNDSHANWEKQPNFVPMDGEIIIYDIDNKHKFQMIKIGDGLKKLSNLPFINDFYTKEEIDAFVKQLQDNIDKETEERKAEDKRLENLIKTEENARIQADNKLQENINKEQQARIENDNKLNKSINDLKESLADIAYTGNVTDLIQDNDNYLIFECNPR